MTPRHVGYPQDMLQDTPPGRDASPTSDRVHLLVSKGPEQAERWARVIEDAGIQVDVEITDRQVVQPGSSPLVGVLGSQPLDFVHVVSVHRQDRERAVAALVDSGWDGREGRAGSRRTTSSRDILVGSAVAVGGLLVFVLIRVLAS